MKRLAEKDLANWYFSQDRAPLIIRGARQVGKSTLVRNFAKNQDLDLIEFNCEIQKLNSLKASESLDLDLLISEIEIKCKKIIKENSLLFLDEIHENPLLIAALRYFYENRPKIAVIAAGSLLEFALRDHDFSFPVGRVGFYYLGPMSFSEFLEALGEELLVEKMKSLDAGLVHHHQDLLKYLRLFYFIGGMPKAVLTYSETKSLLKVRETQDLIIQTYIADFPKYKKRANVDRLEKIFETASFHLGKKVIYQHYDKESTSKEIKKNIELLQLARVLLPCYHSEAQGLPMDASKDETIFKLFFLDIGLVNCLHRLDESIFNSETNMPFLSKGILAEQFIAQHLFMLDGGKKIPRLRYHLRDKGKQKAEIDFLYEFKNKIIPLEVKATEGKSKSIFYFAYAKKWNQGIILSTATQKMEKGVKHKIITQGEQTVKEASLDILHVPLYAIEYLPQLIAKEF